jgi:hypothetical protein
VLRERLVGAEWLDAVYDKMAAGAQAQPGKVLCDMLYALVALDFRLSETKMQRLLGALQQQLPQLSAGHLVTCALCFGRMESPPEDELLAAFLARALELLPAFGPEDLGVSGCALARSKDPALCSAGAWRRGLWRLGGSLAARAGQLAQPAALVGRSARAGHCTGAGR